MSEHVPDDLLSAFVDGDVSEQLAVHIAEHLDACPACNARAVGLDPLAPAFAAVEDPLVPDDLVSAILEEAARPDPAPVLEVGLGAGLLVAAAALVVVFGNPLAMAADLGLVMHALAGLGRGLAVGIGSSASAVVLTSLIGVAGGLTVWKLADSGPLIAPLRRVS